ncbi:MAG: helix-turn-helix transcriptional regulator [Acidobacteria bacterium]|nr:helix-turn-helix transcriptional regulator [Acidobacteriota bacterium]
MRGSRLGQYLRKCRLESRLSLRQVERLSEKYPEKVANSYLSGCERGRLIPSLRKLLVLAAIYHQPVQRLLDELELDLCHGPAPETSDPDELRRLGIHEAQTGDLGRALACFRKRRELLDSESSPLPSDRSAEIRMDVAVVLKRLGKFRPAREEIEGCLRIPELSSRTLVRCLDLLAGVEREMGSLRLARLHSAEAGRLAREIGDPLVLAHTENTLGNILFHSGDPGAAFSHYEAALSTFEAAADWRSSAVTASNLGNCLIRIGKPEDGIRWLEKALQIARERGFRNLAADTLACLARGYFKKGNLDRATDLAYESIGLAREGEYFDVLFTAYYYLWRVARRRRLPLEEKRLLKSLRYFRTKVEGRSPETESFDEQLSRPGREDRDA